jgi:hypothetical protein
MALERKREKEEERSEDKREVSNKSKLFHELPFLCLDIMCTS